jgi:hypothetical protein
VHRRALLLLPAALCSAAAAAGSTGDDVSAARAKATVVALVGFGSRVAGTPAERRAGDWVAGRLRALGYHVSFQGFTLPNGGTSRNVVGRTGGRVRVVLTAHLDSVAAGPGADDNASGVAALLETARALRGTRGVLVAATGAEERVMTHSSTHLGAARLLQSLPRDLAAAISIDEVGYGPSFHVRGIEPRPTRLARTAVALARGTATYLQDPGWSDHAELARAGLPAIWLEWRPDPCGHRSCDVASRVDGEKIAAAARLALATVRARLD